MQAAHPRSLNYSLIAMNPLYVYIALYFKFLLAHSQMQGFPSQRSGSIYSSCPTDSVITNEHREVKDSILNYYNTGPPCSGGGAGGWTRVAHLNMSDPNQQCPSNWTLITTPMRGCGRTSTDHLTCDPVTYSVNGHTYSSVCGRILAYQRGQAAAFHNVIAYVQNTIDSSYVSGLSLTHGPAGNRQHIWTFVGAYYKQDPSYATALNCPCTNTNVSWPYQVPSFIGDDYFCDTGNPGPGAERTAYYVHDPLWDGEGCGPYSTCCSFNSPPWFCKSLPQPTSDDLDIRLCYTDFPSFEDKVVALIDIYVK